MRRAPRTVRAAGGTRGRADWAASLLMLAAGLALAAGCVALFAQLRPLELAARSARTPSTALVARLRAVQEPVLIEWYRSADEQLDGEWRSACADIETLLRSLQRSVPGLRLRIVQPERDEAERGRAAELGLSAVRVRTLVDDGWRERSVWSALRIAAGARGSATLRQLDPQRSARLSELLEAQLSVLFEPARPRYGLSAPPGHKRLRAMLEERGTVVELDFDAEPRLDERLDALFLVDPQAADSRHVAALQAHLARGGDLALFAEPAAPAARLLAAALHAGFDPSDLLDSRAEGGSVLVRSLPQDQDFRLLASQPDGPLLWRAPRAIQTDLPALQAAGCDADLLACAAPETRSADGRTAARAPLLVQLRPRDPWRGRVWLAADAQVAGDELWSSPGNANSGLCAVLADTSAQPERVVSRAAAAASASSAVEVPGSARGAWWLAVLAPAALLAAWQAARRASTAAQALRTRLLATLAVLALLCAIGWMASLWPSASARLHPRTAAIVAGLPAGVRIAVTSDEEAALPADLRAALPRAIELVEAAGGSERNDALASLPRQERTTRDGDGWRTWRYRCAVVVEGPRGTRTLPLDDAEDVAALEFRLALTLARASGQLQARIGVLSAPVRLTPAEARAKYEAKGRFAPGAADRFGAARALLERNGFEVQRLDETQAQQPDVDLLCVLQPRRDAQPVLRALARQLAAGRAALLCAQDSLVVPRARDTNGREFALWPRQQYSDADRYWLQTAGLALDRSLVVDTRHGEARVQGLSEKGETLEDETVLLASPIVPALETRWSAEDGPRRLDAPAPNAWSADATRLAALGLKARPIAQAGADARRIEWSGGELPTDLLAGPAAAERPAVALLVEGAFPSAAAQPEWNDEPPASGRPTKLLLCAASEPFSDAQLSAGVDDSEQVWVEWCTRLALGDEWVELLHERGADRIAPAGDAERIAWRLAAVLLPVALALAFVAWRRRAHAVACSAVCVLAAAFGGCAPTDSATEPLLQLVEPQAVAGKSVAALSVRVDGREQLWYRSKGAWRSREAYGALCDGEALESWLALALQARGALYAPAATAQLGFDAPATVVLHGTALAKRADQDALASFELGAAQTAAAAPPFGRTLARRAGDARVLELPRDLRSAISVAADALPPFVDASLLAGCYAPGFAGFQRYTIVRADGARLVVDSREGATPQTPRSWTVDDGASVAEALPWRAGGYGSLWIRAKAAAYAPAARAPELGFDAPLATVELLDSTGATTTFKVGAAEGGRRWLRNERTGVLCALSSELDNLLLPARDDFLPARPDNPWERWLSR